MQVLRSLCESTPVFSSLTPRSSLSAGSTTRSRRRTGRRGSAHAGVNIKLIDVPRARVRSPTRATGATSTPTPSSRRLTPTGCNLRARCRPQRRRRSPRARCARRTRAGTTALRARSAATSCPTAAKTRTRAGAPGRAPRRTARWSPPRSPRACRARWRRTCPRASRSQGVRGGVRARRRGRGGVRLQVRVRPVVGFLHSY
jgi:hypothetical protein